MPRQNKAKRSLAKMPPEVKDAYEQLHSGVKGLGKSIAEIQRDLRKAERKIAADARARITELRRDARPQLAALESRRSEVTRTLKRLAAAAGGSWRDVKQSADAALAEARSTAASVIERFRNALGG